MKRWLTIGLAAVCVCALALWLIHSRPPRQKLTPLLDAEQPLPSRALPQGCVIAALGQAMELKAPFVLQAQPQAIGHMALVLPKGSATREQQGRARLKVNIPVSGSYQAWLRVLWRDACSNSVCLKIGPQAERTLGHDDVFHAWHWVCAGEFQLQAGVVDVEIVEREDGIALDQLLLTPDSAYNPVGPISSVGEGRGIRRFADDFGRSPGHGLAGWEPVAGKWEIAFSFDPNRIPNQYALAGAPTQAQTEALTLLKGPPWCGCRVAFSLYPEAPGRYGAILDRSPDGQSDLRLEFEVGQGQAHLSYAGEAIALARRVRLKQWHRIELERYGWALRVLVDGDEVLARYDLPVRAGGVGLLVASGQAVFDDVEVEELPWQGDDGDTFRLPWRLSLDAAWFRTEERDAPSLLLGQQGALSVRLPGLPVEAVVLEEAGEHPFSGSVLGADLERDHAASRFVFRRKRFAAGGGTGEVSIQAAPGAPCKLRRVLIVWREPLPRPYCLGPYTFARAQIEDPSDYLDFTPEEYEAMRKSPEAQKLRRQAKFKPLVGAHAEGSPWIVEGGSWQVRSGVLAVSGQNAGLRHAQELEGSFQLRLRLRLLSPESSAAVIVCGNQAPESGNTIRIAGALTRAGELALALPADGQWHDIVVAVNGSKVSAGLALDQVGGRGGREQPRADGAQIRLLVSGRAEFDDIEFTVSRQSADTWLYAFDRRETDWWRVGEWLDHGGIACILASNWISLLAPQADGLMWHKRAFAKDLLVAFDVEEYSEWFGWDKRESHTHHPMDNICLVLGPDEEREHGYRLELNARNRSATLLFRNGQQVAEVRQDRNFPVRYVGGHAPYAPRSNRIALYKRGGLLVVRLNGCEVLRHTDPDPLPVSRVGIGGSKTRLNFSHVEIRTLPPDRGH